jgi:hypothetical protein
MGMLTDFFVASDEDAGAYESRLLADDESSEDDLRSLERVEHKGLTGIELGALWALLADKKFSYPEFGLQVGPMTEESEGILEAFPSDFTRRLAQLPQGSIPGLSTGWADVDGVPHEADELVPILQDLKRLAQAAQSTGRSLYMWYSI